jgi:hypothetical protein
MCKLGFKFSILLFLFLNLQAHANDSRLILVRKIQGLEQLSDALGRQMQTLTLKVASQQPGHQILLSGSDTPESTTVDMVAMEAEVGRSENGYKIETRLLDLRSKKLLTKASLENIREENLLRMFQGALESLFILDEKNPSKVPKVKTPQPVIKKENLRSKPSTTQVNQADPPTLKFRERVLQMKADADESIQKIVNDKQNAAPSAEKLSAPSTQSSSMASPNQVSVAEDPVKKAVIEKTYAKSYGLAGGYDSREIKSQYLVGTTTKAQLLTLKASAFFPMAFSSGKVGGDFDMAYSRAISSPVVLPSIYQIGAFLTWKEERWTLSTGLQQDSSFFVNLPSAGEGLKPQTITGTWLKLKSSFRFYAKGYWKVNLGYGSPLLAQTNYSPLKKVTKWSGLNAVLSVVPPWSYRQWQANFTIEKINLNTSGETSFTLNESRTGLFATRQL